MNTRDIVYDLPGGTLKMAFINQPILFDHPDYSDCWSVQVVHKNEDGTTRTETYRGYEVVFGGGVVGRFQGQPNEYGRKAWVETWGRVKVFSRHTPEEQEAARAAEPPPRVWVSLEEYRDLKKSKNWEV